MDGGVTYGNAMEGRSNLLAVVQNLNCIASPGKVNKSVHCDIFQ